MRPSLETEDSQGSMGVLGDSGEGEWLELSEGWEHEEETAPRESRGGPQGTRKVPGRSRTLDA